MPIVVRNARRLSPRGPTTYPGSDELRVNDSRTTGMTLQRWRLSTKPVCQPLIAPVTLGGYPARARGGLCKHLITPTRNPSAVMLPACTAVWSRWRRSPRKGRRALGQKLQLMGPRSRRCSPTCCCEVV